MLTILSGLLASVSYASSDPLSQRVSRETRPLTQMVWVLVTGVLLVLSGRAAGGRAPGRRGVAGRRAGRARRRALLGALYCLLHGLQAGDLRPHLGAHLAAGRLRRRGRDRAWRDGHAAPCRGARPVCGRRGAHVVRGPRQVHAGRSWALAAGVLFAGVMLCYAYGDIGWLSQAAISRTVSLLITLPVALLTGGIVVPRAMRTAPWARACSSSAGSRRSDRVFVGPADRRGRDHHPFGTFAVILGFVLLHERPKPNQWVGVVCTIAGVSLLAAVV